MNLTIIAYLEMSALLPWLQSSYRTGRSSETAVLKVLSDILLCIDAGDLSVLVLLDLSAAFDTVDHHILLQRLEREFVQTGSSTSSPALILSGVPQGSVVGPILFLFYTADLLLLTEGHGLCPHLYADDTQVYGLCHSFIHS